MNSALRGALRYNRDALATTGQIGIAGAGRMGQALGRLLRECGAPVTAVASRNPEHAQVAAGFIGAGVVPAAYRQLPDYADRLIIAVSDDAVGCVAEILADSGMHGGMALHTCGSRGPEALAALADRGVSCAALHPLQTVATREQGLGALFGVAFAVTGEGPAAAWAEEIVRLLRGQVLRIPADLRPLYHAAAVMASNYVVGLIGAAAALMEAASVDEATALEALRPLTLASAANAFTLGPAKALTGPIARGDLETVAAHLNALAERDTSIEKLYRAAGLHLAKCARANREEMERLLNG